jgi:uncharacterized protein (DUF2236 family)
MSTPDLRPAVVPPLPTPFPRLIRTSDPDQPYFSPGSMYSRVWAERAVYIALPRMLLTQAAHPLVLSGVIGHSAWLGDQFAGRLLRTVKSFRTMAFAPRSESDRLIAVVNEMHDHVRGTLKVDDGGPRYPRGSEFWGLDPPLLLWAMYAIFDSFELGYDTFVRRMTRQEKEEHWQDFRRVGRLFLLEDDEMPRTRADVDDYGRDMLATDKTMVTAVARRRGGEFIKSGRDVDEDRPDAQSAGSLVPWYGRPAWELVKSFTIMTMPQRIRAGYEFDESPARAALVRHSGAASRRVMTVTPRTARTWPEARGARGPWEGIGIKLRPNGTRLLVNVGGDTPKEPAVDAS